jgi:hypothetical protein
VPPIRRDNGLGRGKIEDPPIRRDSRDVPPIRRDNGSGLGRGKIEDPTVGRDRPRLDSDLLTRKTPPPVNSRSGQVQYKSRNNLAGKVQRATRVRIDSIPNDFRNPSLRNQVLRETNVRARNWNLRNGYWSYNPWWSDDWFMYPFYAFDWWPSNCVFSPWYYYPHLPGYIVITRVRFGHSPWFSLEFYDPYEWRYYDRYDRSDYDHRYNGSYEIDGAISDIQRAFRNEDTRYLDEVVPRSGDVYVDLDNGHGYYLSADDFYDLLADNVRSTRTDGYRILDVRRRNDSVRVLAAHDFMDTWGFRTTVYHVYYLVPERGGYVIREFRSSGYRPF